MENSLELIGRLNKDIRDASLNLSDAQARFLVDMYYQVQKYRIANGNQISAIKKTSPEEPSDVLEFFNSQFYEIEVNLKKVLGKYASSKSIGKWLLSIIGIGPILAAGLIAYIDIRKVQTAGQIQAYAGLDPTKKWEKGKLRPFNASLKTLCWKAGQSFIKTSKNKKDVYGHIYNIRKKYESEKNNNLEYADQAKTMLETFNISKSTEAYKWYSKGMLPPAHINQRASRYAVKIFLSHLFSVWYEMEHGLKPPKPYAIAILGHAHEVPVPNWKDGKVIV